MSSQLNPQFPTFVMHMARPVPRCKCPGNHFYNTCPLDTSGSTHTISYRMEEPNESSLVVTHGHEYDKERLRKLIDTPLPEIAKVDISPLLRVQTLYKAVVGSTRLLAATVKPNATGKPWRARGPPARLDDVGASANVAETPASSARNTDSQTEEFKGPNLDEQFLEKMIDMVKGMLSCCEVLVDIAGGAALKERPEPFVATPVPSEYLTQAAKWKAWLQALDRNVVFSEEYQRGMAQLCRVQRGLKKELTKLQGKLPSRPDSQEGIEDVEEPEKPDRNLIVTCALCLGFLLLRSDCLSSLPSRTYRRSP